MPLVAGKLATPDEAIAKDLCPECGADLTKESPIAHRNTHWKASPPQGPRGNEARHRMELLDDFIAKNKVVTSTQRARQAAKTAAPAAAS